MGGGGRTEWRRSSRKDGDNFPRELCVGGSSYTCRVCVRVCVSAAEVCRESVCVTCVCLCHCVSRVINTVTGAVTRAEKVHKFPQAESGMGRGHTRAGAAGDDQETVPSDLSGASS